MLLQLKNRRGRRGARSRSCRSTFSVGKRNAGDCTESAEEPNSSGDHVEIIVHLPLRFRIECDILRVLDQHAVAAFKDKNEFAKWYASNEPLNFTSYRFCTRHATSI